MLYIVDYYTELAKENKHIMTISVHEKFKISSSSCYTENGIDSSNVLKFSSYFFLLIIDMGYIGPKYIVSKNSTFLLINKFQRKKKEKPRTE